MDFETLPQDLGLALVMGLSAWVSWTLACSFLKFMVWISSRNKFTGPVRHRLQRMKDGTTQVHPYRDRIPLTERYLEQIDG